MIFLQFTLRDLLVPKVKKLIDSSFEGFTIWLILAVSKHLFFWWLKSGLVLKNSFFASSSTEDIRFMIAHLCTMLLDIGTYQLSFILNEFSFIQDERY